jgi:hypothetical protein
MVSPHVTEIIPAAVEGRVDVLFVGRDARQWGTFDPESRTVQVHISPQPKDEDLLELAAIETLARKGTVHVLASPEMPEGGAAAAIYRY